MANGAPTLLDGNTAPSDAVPLMDADSPDISMSQNMVQWGIYDPDTNEPVLTADSVVSFGFKKEYKISDYPIEKGTFADYNKVDLPFIADVKMAQGGLLLDRSTFLDQLVTVGTSTQLYNVVTPEHTYLNANIIDYDYQRTSTNGAGMIVADIRLMEIRLTAQASFGNTQSTTDESSVNGGQVSPSAPIPADQQPTEVVTAAQQPDLFPLGYHVPNIGAPL